MKKMLSVRPFSPFLILVFAVGPSGCGRTSSDPESRSTEAGRATGNPGAAASQPNQSSAPAGGTGVQAPPGMPTDRDTVDRTGVTMNPPGQPKATAGKAVTEQPSKR